MQKYGDLVFINTPAPREIDKRLRLLAAQQEVTRSEICRRAFEHYLKSIEKGVEPNGHAVEK